MKKPKAPRYYLAGPMSGLPQFNFPAFDRAAMLLREAGYTVVVPVDLDDPATRALALASPDGAAGSASTNNQTWADYLAADVKLIADNVDGIVLLPGWEKSRGARLEVFVALLTGKHDFLAFVDGPVRPQHISAVDKPTYMLVRPVSVDSIRQTMRECMP